MGGGRLPPGAAATPSTGALGMDATRVIRVTGAGSAEANGIYVDLGNTSNGRRQWLKVDTDGGMPLAVLYDDGGWWIGHTTPACFDLYESLPTDDAMPPMRHDQWVVCTPPSPGYGCAPTPSLSFLGMDHSRPTVGFPAVSTPHRDGDEAASSVAAQVEAESECFGRAEPGPAVGAHDAASLAGHATAVPMSSSRAHPAEARHGPQRPPQESSSSRSTPSQSHPAHATTVSRIRVDGAGTAAANGLYVLAANDTHDGRPYWRSTSDPDVAIVYNHDAWAIGSSDIILYQTAPTDTSLPPCNDRVAWSRLPHGGGVAPAPTLCPVPDPWPDVAMATAAEGAAVAAAAVNHVAARAEAAARAAAPHVKVALAHAATATREAVVSVHGVAHRDVLPALAEGGATARRATQMGLDNLQTFTDRVIVPAVADGAAVGRTMVSQGADALAPVAACVVGATNDAVTAIAQFTSSVTRMGTQQM
eukprot:m.173753 g.173753  ORF g.173753 m.173753 type:complete len:476 (+) comp13738_c0_seq1:78-1505(+)